MLAKLNSRTSEHAKKRSVHRSGRAILGTLVTIKIEHQYASEARKIINLAFDEIYRVQNLMSVYDNHSEVYALNRDGFYKDASPETIEVINKGVFYSKISGGAFNIAILPVLRLWQEKIKLGAKPTDTELREALKYSNWKDIIIEGNNIRFRKLGMGVTLGGVAKGFAIDNAINKLKHSGVTRAMVNGGGDISVISESGESPWRIGVRSPDKKRELISVIELTKSAITTSGTYLRDYNDLLNHGGNQATAILSSTVIAQNAMDADPLSTAIYILGVEKGISFIEEKKGVEALIITKDRKVIESSNFKLFRCKHGKLSD